MPLLKSTSLVCCFLVTSAMPALAQEPRPAPAPAERGYLIGGGGASFGPQTASTFGVEIGEKMGPVLQAYVAFSYFDDLMPDEARSNLVLAAQHLEALTLTPWDFHGRDRGRAFTAGAKVALPGTVRPYVGGGVGAMNLKRVVTERYLGNVTESFRAQFGTTGDVLDSSQASTTKPRVEAAAGVGLIAGRAYLDVGYRYRRAFHAFEGTFDFSQFTVSAGIAF